MAAVVSMAMTVPVSCAAQQKEAVCFKPPQLPSKFSKAAAAGGAESKPGRLPVIRAASSPMKEKLAAGVSAGLIAASAVAPMAEAASGVSPSLKNFLLSIAAGGAVLLAIVGAVIGVANFDPVKRS
uniref:Photosystem II subunit X n=1 Tax=Kalanchoe fedtschenkoi TaxID=63787 RepID=A0A7N0ZQH0_KALFE